MSDQNDEATTKTPLLAKTEEPENEKAKNDEKEEVFELKIVSETVEPAALPAPKSPTKSVKSAKSAKESKAEKKPPAVTLPSEYKFVHQRIPAREGKLRFLLPALLIGFQVVFIILFAFFGSYQDAPSANETLRDSRQYPCKYFFWFLFV
jgi:hypothetical protein